MWAPGSTADNVGQVGSEPFNPFSTFNDSKQFWFPEQPTAGVKIPNNGVNIKVLEREGTTMKVRVSSRN